MNSDLEFNSCDLWISTLLFWAKIIHATRKGRNCDDHCNYRQTCCKDKTLRNISTIPVEEFKATSSSEDHEGTMRTALLSAPGFCENPQHAAYHQSISNTCWAQVNLMLWTNNHFVFEISQRWVSHIVATQKLTSLLTKRLCAPSSSQSRRNSGRSLEYLWSRTNERISCISIGAWRSKLPWTALTTRCPVSLPLNAFQAETDMAA